MNLRYWSLYLLPLASALEPSWVWSDANFVQVQEMPFPQGSLVEPYDEVSDFDAQLSLAKILADKKGTANEAFAHLTTLLQQKPNDLALDILMSKVLVKKKQYSSAATYAQKVFSSSPNDPKVLMDLAYVEADLGHVVIARDLFEQALGISDEQREERLLAYAGLMQLWGEYARAECIFKQYLAQHPDSIDVQMRLADAYAGEGRYFEAEQIYYQILCRANSTKGMLGFARVKFFEKDFDAAFDALPEVTVDDPLRAEVLRLKAQILEKRQQFDEAGDVYRIGAIEAQYPEDRFDALIRAYVAYDKGCRDDLAQMALDEARSIDPHSVAILYYTAEECVPADFSDPEHYLELAGLYAEEGDTATALGLYEKALDRDPDYYPAMIAMADLLPNDFRYGEARAIYENLLCEFPENPKFMLGAARVASWDKLYRTSIAQYDYLITLYPDNPVLKLERARVAMWEQEGLLGYCFFTELVDSSDPNQWAGFHIRQNAELERDALWASWNRGYIEALCDFQQLIELNPGNEEYLFDYAETLCVLGECENALCVFEEIHAIDPQHTFVNMAIERHHILTEPAIIGGYTFWNEVGRGQLSGISRHKFSAGLEYPIDCQTRVRVLNNYFLDHTYINQQNFTSNSLSVEYAQVFNRWCAISGAITEKYGTNYDIHGRMTGRARLDVRYGDLATAAVGWERKDEYYNYFGVKRGVQSDSAIAKLAVWATRWLLLEGTYQNYWYNDDNVQTFGEFDITVQLTEYPHILRLIVQGEHRNTTNMDQFVYVGNTLVDIIHPYWTPQHYYAGRVGLGWWHDLSRFSFCGSEKEYYSFQWVVSDDTQDNLGTSLSGEYHLDWCDRWSTQLNVALYRSRQWNAEGIWSTISYRF